MAISQVPALAHGCASSWITAVLTSTEVFAHV